MYKSYSELGSSPEENRDIYSVEEIQNPRHKAQIIGQNRIVCVDIYADWCGPCKQTAPDYANLAKQFNKPGQVSLVKENYDRKMSPSVQGVPTFYFYVNGRVVDEVVGADINEVNQKLIGLTGSAGNPTPINGQRGIDIEALNGPPSGKGIRKHASPYQGQTLPDFSSEPYRPDAGNTYHQPYQQYGEQKIDYGTQAQYPQYPQIPYTPPQYQHPNTGQVVNQQGAPNQYMQMQPSLGQPNGQSNGQPRYVQQNSFQPNGRTPPGPPTSQQQGPLQTNRR